MRDEGLELKVYGKGEGLGFKVRVSGEGWGLGFKV